MKSTLKTIQTLTLLLGVSALPLSMCQAQTVFEDFTSADTAGNPIVGSTPVIGTGVWEGTAGGQLLDYGQSSGNNNEAAPYAIYTDGAARQVFGAFTSALGAGQELIVSFNLLGFGGGWPNSGGFAGVSLYTGYTSADGNGNPNAGANENQFIGEPYNANQIGLDSTVSGYQGSGNTTVPTLATYTYVYNTGAWSFTTTGGVNLSGTGPTGMAFNGLEIHNGAGADIDLDNLSATIVPEPSIIALTGTGIGLLLGLRRRYAPSQA